MRPRHKTAEYQPLQASMPKFRLSFNEAAAQDRGIQAGADLVWPGEVQASMRPRHKTAEYTVFSQILKPLSTRFNEAAAQDRGIHDDTLKQDGWLSASMRPRHKTAEYHAR